MHKLVPLSTTLLLFLSLPAMAGTAKVDICHLNDDHSWHLITVAESAVDAHLAHGDWLLSRDVVDGVDNDCDGEIDEYFEPFFFSWNFFAAVQDGQVVSAFRDGEEIPPMFELNLVEEEYLDTGEGRYGCILPFTVEVTTGPSDPGAWFDWTLTLTPTTEWVDVCDNIDPAMFGGDAWAYYSSFNWEMAILELDEVAVAAWEEYLGDEWADWEPYLYGGNTWIDGVDLNALDDADWMNWMVNSGLAITIDADREIGEDYLETSAVAERSDGYYQIWSSYIWYI